MCLHAKWFPSQTFWTHFKLYNRPRVENEDKMCCDILWFWSISGFMFIVSVMDYTCGYSAMLRFLWGSMGFIKHRLRTFFKQVSIHLKPLLISCLIKAKKSISITRIFFILFNTMEHEFPVLFQHNENNLKTTSFLLTIWHPDTCCNDPWHPLHKEQALISTTCL